MSNNIVSVSLCCNNANTGMPEGKIFAVDIGTELLTLEGDLTGEVGPTLQYNFKVTQRNNGFGCDRVEGSISVDAHSFPIIGYKYGWGNWCWDCVIMTPEVAIEFINYLKELDQFACTAGDSRLFNLFNKAGTKFGSGQIRILEKFGYQAP